MMKFRGCLRWGLALGLGLALAAQTASAGTLEIVLTINSTNGPGPLTVSILGDGFNNSGNTDRSLSADTTNLLNPFLQSVGYGDISFSSLGTGTNIPGETISSFITLSGTVNVAANSTLGDITITALAYGLGYTVPPTPAGPGVLASSSQAGFGNTVLGDKQTFQSWYNSNNSDSTSPPDATGTLLQTLAPINSLVGKPPKSLSDDANPVDVGFVSPFYSLINQSVVTIHAGISTTTTVTFGGLTVLTVVPEPASVVMMMSALPAVFGLIRRSRRGMKTIG